ncbi:MAG: bifunctional oligoribonuclease/PAP phosphatase NrnA [Weeksellaceae bacterium]|nr:bifunctional oligoribonuclease/PAP phosphatase NrnA [Weeksellaceae bacterium]
MFTTEEIQELKKIFSTPQKIAIIPHRNPDGDAIGSCLALFHMLQSKGHTAKIVAPNDFPKFLKWLPGAKKQVQIAEFNDFAAGQIIGGADVVFILDFNTPSRADNLAVYIKSASGIKIMIDHHQEPDDFHYNYSDVEMPATAQMVYHWFQAMDWEDDITTDIATCIYTGLLTDTGNFRYPSVKPSTLEAAAALLRKGAEPHLIMDQLYDVSSPQRLKLLSVFLQNLTYVEEYRTAVFTLSREELLANEFQKGDTEGFVNYGLNINNALLSVFISEDTTQDLIKLSFRSKDDFDVNKLAREHFSGGGHINAAGGRSEKTLDETKKQLLELLPLYDSELKNEN